MKHSMRLVCVMVLWAILCQNAKAGLISENFDSYTINSALNGQNGGSGFESAWSGSGFNVSANGFGSSNAATGAGTMVRSLPFSVTSIFGLNSEIHNELWLSFDFSRSASGNNFSGINFYEGGTERVLIGHNGWSGGASPSNWMIAKDSQAGIISNVSFETIKTGVVRFNLAPGAGGSADLWVGDGVGPVDVFAAPTLSIGGLTLSGIDSIAIRGSNSFTVDDIRMDTSLFGVNAVPEPSSLLLVGLAVFGAVGRRRRVC